MDLGPPACKMPTERILALGCGPDDSRRKLGLHVENCQVVGIDIQRDGVQTAYLESSSQGWSWYAHIPRTLAELHRVLGPGGWPKASLHTPSFTGSEFRRSCPHPKQCLFLICVLLKGMVLHFSASVISLGQVAESCQTSAGMRIAPRRAGFTALSHRKDGCRFFVEARREGAVAVTEPMALRSVA